MAANAEAVPAAIPKSSGITVKIRFCFKIVPFFGGNADLFQIETLVIFQLVLNLALCRYLGSWHDNWYKFIS